MNRIEIPLNCDVSTSLTITSIHTSLDLRYIASLMSMSLSPSSGMFT